LSIQNLSLKKLGIIPSMLFSGVLYKWWLIMLLDVFNVVRLRMSSMNFLTPQDMPHNVRHFWHLELWGNLLACTLGPYRGRREENRRS
jgi:hypothetical protein